MKSSRLALYPALAAAAVRNIDLTGKSLLITGGGYGIGVSIVKSFVSRNILEVILVGRTESKLKATGDEPATAATTAIRYVVADISKPADVQSLFASLDKSPEILVSNAGYLPQPGSFVDGDISEWWRGFGINVWGTVLVTQAYLRHRRNEKNCAGQ